MKDVAFVERRIKLFRSQSEREARELEEFMPALIRLGATLEVVVIIACLEIIALCWAGGLF